MSEFVKYSTLYMRKRRRTEGFATVLCFICKKRYQHLGSHVVQSHKILAKDYRKMYCLPIKRGILPTWLKEQRAKQSMKNRTFLNLKEGARFWYKRNDPRTKIKIGFKSNAKGAKRKLEEILM